jgi:signal transduction histidine kinase
MIRGLARRMVIASTLVAIVIAAAFVVAIQKIDDMSRSTQAANDSQTVLVSAQEVERLISDVQTDALSFVFTGQAGFLVPWQAAQAQLPGAENTLLHFAKLPAVAQSSRQLVTDSAAYVQNYSIPLVAAARAHDPSATTVARLDQGVQRMTTITAGFDAVSQAEQNLVVSRHADVLSAGQVARGAVMAGLIASVVLIVSFALYLSRAMVRPIRRAAGMARTLADGELSARMPETGIGEIGGLERSFNVMAQSLEVSQDRQNRLADEQAALRRVATLVARGGQPGAIFDAVTEELAQLLDVTRATMLRAEVDGSETVVSSWGASSAAAGSDSDAEAGAAVSASIVVNDRLWGRLTAAAERPLPEEAATRIANFTDLVATAIANSDARAELAASRVRLVSATDQARHKIERDLHDGTQQRLVSLALDLRMTGAEIPDQLAEIKSEISTVADGLTAAMNDLREITHGIHPAILSEGGLEPAVKALARRSPIPVNVDAHLTGRLPQNLEIACYYVVAEALTNCAKHAQASVANVVLQQEDGGISLSISDDGVGGANPAKGSGLVGLIDRVEAFGGTVNIASPPGKGTALRVHTPLDPAVDR